MRDFVSANSHCGKLLTCNGSQHEKACAGRAVDHNGSVPDEASPHVRLRHWLLPLGLLLVIVGIAGWFLSLRKSAANAPVYAGLVCKIQAPAPPRDPKHPDSVATVPAPTLLTGATLQLTGATRASVEETVVVSLCVQPAPELPEQRRQALKNHLLVQLSAVGLQIEPREKVPTTTSGPGCLGTAEWTLRANTPGRYSAVLVPASTDDQPGQPASDKTKPRWDFDLERPARLNIQFQDAWTSIIQKIWSPVSALVGIVLVITQIRVNLQRKKAGT